MENLTDSERSLAWCWVVEAMASYKDVSLSLLHDLVEAAPDFDCGLAKNAKEMVALRCLEDLFTRQSRTKSDGPSVPGPKVEFSFSASCEDALQRIVQETSPSDLKLGGPELAKWDIEPFIRHKRANMPKSALEMLSHSVADGTHPHADFLMEKISFGSVNQKAGVCMNNKNHCSVTTSPNLACSGAKDTRAELVSNSSIVENLGKKSEGNPRKGDILPSKRGRSDSAAKDRAGEMETSGGKDSSDVNNFKKAKHHASSDSRVVEKNSVPLCGEDLPERNVSVSVKETMREVRVSVEGSEDCRVSKKSDDNHNKAFHENEPVNPRNAPLMPQEATEQNLNLPTDGSKRVDEKHAKPSGSPSFKTLLKDQTEEPKSRSDHDFQFQCPDSVSRGGPEEKMDAHPEEETSSDADEYQNERTDVTRKKHEFFSSQLTDSRHSKIADSLEQNLCMKCNEPGRALVCGSNSCQLVVHEKCIGSSPILNEKGSFCCPFCSYSRAITEYLDAKKRSSSACKDLSAFVCKGLLEYGPEKSIDSSKKKHCGGGTEDQNYVGSNQLEEIREKDTNQAAINEKEECIIADNQQCTLSETCDVNANVECEGKRTSIYERKLRSSAGGKVSEEKAVEECRWGRSEGRQKSGNRGKEDSETPPKASDEEDAEAPTQLADEFNIGSEEKSEGDDDDDSSVSDYCVRLRKREAHYTSYPAIPQLRRKMVPWTAEEEELIKVGVRQFCNGRSIQWKKILESGDGVFLKGRTTIDLKDKWRNMCKGSPKPK